MRFEAPGEEARTRPTHGAPRGATFLLAVSRGPGAETHAGAPRSVDGNENGARPSSPRPVPITCRCWLGLLPTAAAAAAAAATTAAAPTAEASSAAAAAAAASAAAEAAATAAAAATGRALAGLVHVDGAAVEVGPVHLGDGVASRLSIGERDEPEPAAATRVTVGHDLRFEDFPETLERFTQSLIRSCPS